MKYLNLILVCLFVFSACSSLQSKAVKYTIRTNQSGYVAVSSKAFYGDIPVSGQFNIYYCSVTDNPKKPNCSAVQQEK